MSKKEKLCPVTWVNAAFANRVGATVCIRFREEYYVDDVDGGKRLDVREDRVGVAMPIEKALGLRNLLNEILGDIGVS